MGAVKPYFEAFWGRHAIQTGFPFAFHTVLMGSPHEQYLFCASGQSLVPQRGQNVKFGKGRVFILLSIFALKEL